jgi:hypothetical protein
MIRGVRYLVKVSDLPGVTAYTKEGSYQAANPWLRDQLAACLVETILTMPRKKRPSAKPTAITLPS